MRALRLPRGWAVLTVRTRLPYGHYATFKDDPGVVTIGTADWTPFRTWVNLVVFNHEAGHAWGVEGCRKPWCLMFEMQTWHPRLKGSWMEKVVTLLFWPWRWFRYCWSCEARIKVSIIKEDL